MKMHPKSYRRKLKQNIIKLNPMDTICNKKYVLEAVTKQFLTLKYLIKEYACLSFLEFLPPWLALFHISNKQKICHPIHFF